MKNALTGILFFGIGVIALLLSSYTRTFQIEYIQFPILFAFFLLCGWLISLFCNTIWFYPLLFMFPTVAILVVAFITNSLGRFHYIGETITIIPGFLIGFYFHHWSKKLKITAVVLLPAFYLLYIFKLNPELDYYNNSVRREEIVVMPDKPVPDFKFQNQDKSLFNLADYKGKVILIDFYFNRCSQCREKLPKLKKIQHHYSNNKKFLLIAVHSGIESFEDFSSTLENLPQGLRFAYDSGSRASKYFGIDGYPHEILIDKNGYIRSQFAGFNDDVSLVYFKNRVKKIDALINEIK